MTENLGRKQIESGNENVGESEALGRKSKIKHKGIISLVALVGLVLGTGSSSSSRKAEGRSSSGEKRAYLDQVREDAYHDIHRYKYELGGDIDLEVQPEKKLPTVSSAEVVEYPTQTFYDRNPDFFKEITVSGEFTEEERLKRTKEIAPGVTVFEDVGVTFYIVQDGDTLSEIKKKLTALPKFAYISEQPNVLQSFNIPAEELTPGMFLPIPMRNADRMITVEQFAAYAALGILDMKENEIYGGFVRGLLERMSEQELLATCIAVAKQESGSKSIGQFENYSWEANKKAFSFSVYKIMMLDAGLNARRNVNVSEGQMYHPEIATKVFLAYLYEKGAAGEKIFPIDQHLEAFASFYNGGKWREVNPNYAKNLGVYYADAWELMRKIIEERSSLVVRTTERPLIDNQAEPVVTVAQNEKEIGAMRSEDDLEAPISRTTSKSPTFAQQANMEIQDIPKEKIREIGLVAENRTSEPPEISPVPAPGEFNSNIYRQEKPESAQSFAFSGAPDNLPVEQVVPKEAVKIQEKIESQKVEVSARSSFAEKRGQVYWQEVGNRDISFAIAQIIKDQYPDRKISGASIGEATKDLISKLNTSSGKGLDETTRIGIGKDLTGLYVIIESDPNDRSSRVVSRLG